MGNKNILKIDDRDGNLHLYICAAYHGKRWAAQMFFDANERTLETFNHRGIFLITATAISLRNEEIISG
jgi:hypothetical protein